VYHDTQSVFCKNHISKYVICYISIYFFRINILLETGKGLGILGKIAIETMFGGASSKIRSLSEGNYGETAMKQVYNLNLDETLN